LKVNECLHYENKGDKVKQLMSRDETTMVLASAEASDFTLVITIAAFLLMTWRAERENTYRYEVTKILLASLTMLICAS
jgi:hypothetical protein